jgi:hypothetical protein
VNCIANGSSFRTYGLNCLYAFKNGNLEQILFVVILVSETIQKLICAVCVPV